MVQNESGIKKIFFEKCCLHLTPSIMFCTHSQVNSFGLVAYPSSVPNANISTNIHSNFTPFLP